MPWLCIVRTGGDVARRSTVATRALVGRTSFLLVLSPNKHEKLQNQEAKHYGNNELPNGIANREGCIDEVANECPSGNKNSRGKCIKSELQFKRFTVIGHKEILLVLSNIALPKQ